MAVRGSRSVRFNLESDAAAAWYRQIADEIDSTRPVEADLDVAKSVAMRCVPAEAGRGLSTVLEQEGPDLVILSGLGAPQEYPAVFRQQMFEYAFLGLAQLSGESFGFREDSQRLIHDVTPKPSGTGGQHRGAIGYHIDAAVLGLIDDALIPDGIGLAGVRNESGAGTRFLHLEHLVDELGPGVVKALCSERFHLDVPPSLGPSAKLVPLTAVLRRSGDDFLLACTPSSCAALDMEHAEALRELSRGIERLIPMSESICIQPGDIVIWSQRKFLHARDSFEGERHLQRVFLTRRGNKSALAQFCSEGRIWSASRIFQNHVKSSV